jgi:protein tyrosine phosphatase
MAEQPPLSADQVVEDPLPKIDNLEHEIAIEMTLPSSSWDWESLDQETFALNQPELFNQHEATEAFVWHRFSNTRCLSETVVEVDEVYLHANYIKFDSSRIQCIASQAPVKEWEESYFWKFIFEQEYVICDLTAEEDVSVEWDEIEQGVTAYYPQQDDIRSYRVGNYEIKYYTGHDIYNTYTMKNTETKKEKTVHRYHVNNWEYGKAITVRELTKLVDLLWGHEPKKFWIHSHAGIGRAGVLVVACYLKEKILNGEMTLETLPQEVYQQVLAIRKQRKGAVETQEQFQLLHDYANLEYKASAPRAKFTEL